ncbi:hypothetical protein D3C71_1309560 [compost metagenome]
MEDAFRMLIVRTVVAEHQIRLVAAACAPADDWRNRVMRHALAILFAEGQNIGGGIAVALPGFVQVVRAFQQHGLIFTLKPHDGHRPVHHPEGYTRIGRMGERLLDRRLLKREGMAAALKMVMRQNRSADNRQIGIRADEIVREIAYKGQKPL